MFKIYYINMELSEETKRDIKQAEKEFKEGKFYTHEEVKKKLGLDKNHRKQVYK